MEDGVPQPAFDQMDAVDAFWAASIAARFTDPMIKAIVDAGELSDPEAASYLTDVIIKRRDKVFAYWIGMTNPLDRFAVERLFSGAELASTTPPFVCAWSARQPLTTPAGSRWTTPPAWNAP